MDPSSGSMSEGVQPSPNNQTQSNSNNLPNQRPLGHYSQPLFQDNGGKKKVAVIKPQVKTQQQKAPSRSEYSQKWNSPSNSSNRMTQPDSDKYASHKNTEDLSDYSKQFDRNMVMNVMARTSFSKPFNRIGHHQSPLQEKPRDSPTKSDPVKVSHSNNSIVPPEVLETDPSQRPASRRSIPPPAPKRSASYGDLTAPSPGENGNGAMKQPTRTEIMNHVVRFVSDKKRSVGVSDRRSFDKGSLERPKRPVSESNTEDTDRKLAGIETLTGSASNSPSSSPDTNISRRIECPPSQESGESRKKSPLSQSRSSHWTNSTASPYRSNLQILPNFNKSFRAQIPERSKSTTSLNKNSSLNTRRDSLNAARESPENGQERDRRRNPLVFSDESQHDRSSGSSPEVGQRNEGPISFRNQQTKHQHIMPYPHRSPSPHHPFKTENEFVFDSPQPSPSVGTAVFSPPRVPSASMSGYEPVRLRNNSGGGGGGARVRERPHSAYNFNEQHLERVVPRSEPLRDSKSEENMLNPVSSHRPTHRSRPNSALGNLPGSQGLHRSFNRNKSASHEQLLRSDTRSSRPISQDLDNLDTIPEIKTRTGVREGSVVEMINRLNLNEPTGQTTGNNQPTASPMTHQSVTQSQSFSGSSRSSAGVHQLHPISENSSKSTEVTPPVRTLSTPARIIRSSSGGSEQINRFRPIRTDSPGYAPVATHRPPPSSSSVSRDSPHSPSPTAQLSRNSSISASSSIGLDTSFPPLPAQVLEQTDEPEVTQTQPDDIKATYQKIRNASRDLENQSETPIELVPEPPVLNLPDTFFQPKIICQLKLNDDARSESEQEGSSSSCDGPGGHGSRHSDIQEMIKKQEKAIIDFTSDREELIKESRQNELFGDEIIKIIRLKCPSILGILV
jgi:hypothetical protein